MADKTKEQLQTDDLTTFEKFIQEYIDTLKFVGASEDEKTLVIGNLRNAFYHMRKTLFIHKDSIRCMSEVMTDIANVLGIPENRHGNPDLIFDQIRILKAKASKE